MLKISRESEINLVNVLIDNDIISGKDLIDIKKYSVSVSGYLANGGDGYQILTKGRVLSNDKPFQDALYDEFKKVKTIQIPTLGRQINVSDLTKTSNLFSHSDF